MCDACQAATHGNRTWTMADAGPDICSGFAMRRELLASLPFYRSHARRLLGSHCDADDVVQSFALKAIERATQLREPRAARSWLWRLLRTTMVDHHRRGLRERLRQVSYDPSRHDRAEDASSACPADLNRLLAVALASVKRDYAHLLAEIDLHDRPAGEVAVELGITTNNLAVRLHRARRSARHVLAAQLGAD